MRTIKLFLENYYEKSLAGLMIVAVLSMSLWGCGGNAKAIEADANEAEANETDANANEVVEVEAAEEATDTEATGDIYEKIASDIAALSENSELEFDYGQECRVESIEPNPENGKYTVSVICSREMGDGVFPRVIGYVQNNAGEYTVSMVAEPENVKNVEVVLLNSSDGSLVETCASVHEEDDGTYLIKFFGM